MDSGAVTEEEILTQLRRVVGRVDPVPRRVVAAAQAAYSWRTLESELAELTYDSSLEAPELAGIRGGSGRLLVFSSARVTVELEISGRDRRLVGQVDGPGNPRLEIQHSRGFLPVKVDQVGRFSASDLPAGPMRLRLTDEEGGTVTESPAVLI
ncbi:MAG: hypothetical protein ABR540_13020 [Acidimicrobiales bacterium]|nr:hypothetical protein [Actinomycetota bacterium]